MSHPARSAGSPADTQVEIGVVPETTQPQPLYASSRLAVARPKTATQQPVMPDDHSESVPPLPIPNRTVKRLHADDSADSRVKVGNRQAPHASPLNPHPTSGGFVLSASAYK